MLKSAQSAIDSVNMDSTLWDELRSGIQDHPDHKNIPSERFAILFKKLNAFVTEFRHRRSELVVMNAEELNSALIVMVGSKQFGLPQVVPRMVKEFATQEVVRLQGLCRNDPELIAYLSRLAVLKLVE